MSDIRNTIIESELFALTTSLAQLGIKLEGASYNRIWGAMDRAMKAAVLEATPPIKAVEPDRTDGMVEKVMEVVPADDDKLFELACEIELAFNAVHCNGPLSPSLVEAGLKYCRSRLTALFTPNTK